MAVRGVPTRAYEEIVERAERVSDAIARLPHVPRPLAAAGARATLDSQNAGPAELRSAGQPRAAVPTQFVESLTAQNLTNEDRQGILRLA